MEVHRSNSHPETAAPPRHFALKVYPSGPSTTFEVVESRNHWNWYWIDLESETIQHQGSTCMVRAIESTEVSKNRRKEEELNKSQCFILGSIWLLAMLHIAALIVWSEEATEDLAWSGERFHLAQIMISYAIGLSTGILLTKIDSIKEG